MDLMKKLIALLLLLSLTSGGIGLMTVGASAFFGTGGRVVAAGVTMIKTGLIGQRISFTDGDFKSALALESFDSITITEIPSSTEGTLLLNGRRVGKGRVIKRKNLGGLVFIPASDAVSNCSFSFTVEGYAGGAEIECILKFIDKVNYAPKALGDSVSAANIETQASISVWGNLYAQDPEGDALEYIVVSYPKRGILTLSDPKSGRYCYTPIGSYTGKDKFTFVARDEYGNYSTPITVSVRINDRMCDAVYGDMEDRAEYNAAVAMTAMGIMSGRQMGDELYFCPDEEVSRAEFVAMAMRSIGIRQDTTLSGTYFDDDGDISPALKGYIATAQRAGFIIGDFKDGRLMFSPNESITKYEAAKILATMIGNDEDDEESVFAQDSSIPVWARASVGAMYSLGIFDSNDGATLLEKVSRADVAEFLYRLSRIKR